MSKLRASKLPRRLESARAMLVAVFCAAAIAVFAVQVDDHYAIRDWLAWRVLMLWGYTLALNLSCVTLGHSILRRAFGMKRLPPAETWLTSMALGLVAFVLALYVAGSIGAFHPAVAVLLPFVFIALGASDLRWLVARTARYVRRPRRSTALERVIHRLAVAGALLAFGVLYLIALSPDAIHFDASWYHLPIAHDYVRHGRFVPFPGDYVRVFPHLASMLYTWGFLLPSTQTPLDWMMALHIEYSIVVWNAVAVAVAAQWMLRDFRVRGLWTATFLFPLVFAFGTSVGAAADHMVGFWAVPMFVATGRLLRDLDVRWAALLGVLAGGAVLTKYQAIYMIAACGSIIAVRWLWLVIRRAGAPSWSTMIRSPLVVIALATAVALPHFLKNAIFYRNPLYPFAQNLFTNSTPTHPRAAELFSGMLGETDNQPKGHGWERVRETLELFGDFSFVPHYTVDWVEKWPLFGSLFTLLIPCALLVRGPGRIWLGIWGCTVVLLVWGNTYLTDRYLLAAVPLFAGTTAAMIVRAHELGPIARVGLYPLVAFQIVWGADAWTWSGKKLIDGSMALVRSGYEGRLEHDERFPHWKTFRSVSDALPTDAVVLVRGSRPTLGLDRDVVEDLQWNQASLWYEPVDDARELWQLYRDRGITHLLYLPDVHYSGTIQSSVLFATLVKTRGLRIREFGKYDLVDMPDAPPPADDELLVVTRRLKFYGDGLYPVGELDVYGRMQTRLDKHEKRRPTPRIDLAEEPKRNDEAFALADAVVVGGGVEVSAAEKKILREDFDKVEDLGTAVIWLRRR